ncbi:hypothetical protein [Brevibacillus laterosporus]|uniref:hypothetical protein n=1 Tax=Brevibacillus laterosporus TaxID=1465 RepID=UPI000E6CC376|nr:hypothetical protein [Brevibacillus laterosporus]AYB37609.1 hypothetical protein D5F52_04550 [Brevibacillus laterosporus]MBM7110851.1 hypothetical protein [Brevibacillus laterosporus]
MTEQESLIAWLYRRIQQSPDLGTIRFYYLYFKDMWLKEFGTLTNIPEEVYDQIRMKRESLKELID